MHFVSNVFLLATDTEIIIPLNIRNSIAELIYCGSDLEINISVGCFEKSSNYAVVHLIMIIDERLFKFIFINLHLWNVVNLELTAKIGDPSVNIFHLCGP